MLEIENIKVVVRIMNTNKQNELKSRLNEKHVFLLAFVIAWYIIMLIECNEVIL